MGKNKKRKKPATFSRRAANREATTEQERIKRLKELEGAPEEHAHTANFEEPEIPVPKKKTTKKKAIRVPRGDKTLTKTRVPPNPIVDDPKSALLPSSELARRAFAWLIHPVTVEEFYSQYFEQQPLYIPRNAESLKEHSAGGGDIDDSGNAYYNNIFGKKDIDNLLRTRDDIHYTRDINITKYENDQRSTLDPGGRATADQVWDFFKKGCSVRFLCPQRFQEPLWKLLGLLDEFWGSGAGANSYLTPQGTQGFAPHYDEVDVFVIQTEGAKRWRLYPHRFESEVLDEISSRNFKQNEIGEPVIDIVLRKGDFLYAPRGTIHQCVACPGQDSLHVTLSTCLKNSWGEFLRRLVPRALQLAFSENINMRESLPRDMYNFMGVIHSDKDDPRRAEFANNVISLIQFALEPRLLPLDGTADKMACDFMHGRVPPVLPEAQKQLCFSEDKEKVEIQSNTRVRLVRQGVARLTIEETELGHRALVHHIMGNSRLYKGEPLSHFDYPLSYAPTIEALLESYPDYISVDALPLPQEPVDEEDEDDAEDDPEDESALEEVKTELIERLYEARVLQLHPSDVNLKIKSEKPAAGSPETTTAKKFGFSGHFGGGGDTSGDSDSDDFFSAKQKMPQELVTVPSLPKKVKKLKAKTKKSQKSVA